MVDLRPVFIQSNLRREMSLAGLSMRQLSLAAGLKADAVRDILRGKSANPSAETVYALANALGIPAERLMYFNSQTSEKLVTKTITHTNTKVIPKNPEERRVDSQKLGLAVIALFRRTMSEEQVDRLLDKVLKPTAPGTPEREESERVLNGILDAFDGYIQEMRRIDWEADRGTDPE